MRVSFCVGMVGLAIATSDVSASALVIDDFTTPTAQAASCAPPTGTVVSTGSSITPETVSGERTLSASVTSLLSAGGCSTMTVGAGRLTISNDDGVLGASLITWDITGSTDLSGFDSLSLQLRLTNSIAPDNNTSFELRFCTDDLCQDHFSRQFLINGEVLVPQIYPFPLASFTPFGAPSWASISRVSLRVQSGNSSDLEIDNILLAQAVPEPSTLALAAGGAAGALLVARWRRTRGNAC